VLHIRFQHTNISTLAFMFKRHLWILVSALFLFSIHSIASESSESDTMLAQKYLHIADSLSEHASSNTAAKYFLKASEIYLQLHDWRNYAHCKIWETYMDIDLGLYNEAIDNMNTAIININKYLSPNNMYSFTCSVRQSIVYYELDNCNQSFYILKNAIDLFKTNPEWTTPDGQKRIATAYFEYGNNYLKAGKRDSALFMYKQTLGLREKYYEKNHNLILDCYNNLGIMYEYYGDYELANVYMLKTLQGREEKFGFANWLTAWSYTNLAIVNQDLGDLEKALQYAKKGMESRNLCLPPGHIEFASSYSTIANIYNRTGDFDTSLEYNKKAIEIYDHKLGSDNVQSAAIYNNIADNFNRQGKYDTSLNYFKKSYVIYLRNKENDIRPEQSLCEYNIADTYIAMNQIDSALYYNGLSYKSNFTPAIESHNIEAVLDFDLAFMILEQKATIQEIFFKQDGSIKHLITANNIYSRYIELLDYFRIRMIGTDSKVEFIERNNNIMDRAIHVAYQLFETDPAMFSAKDVGWLIEKNKSNILLEVLSKTKTKNMYIPDSLSLTWRETTGQIYQLKVEIENVKSQDNPQYVTTLTDSLFLLQTKLYKLNEFIQDKYPDFNDQLNLEVSDFNKSQIKLYPQTAILNYYLTDSLLYIFYISADKEIIRTTPLDTLFHNDVIDYLNSLKKNRIGSVDKLGSKLYSILIDPVKDLIQTKTKLVVIPDKCLYYLPFETLTLNNPNNGFSKKDFLINSYEIVYHYSATMYCKFLRSESRIHNKNLTFNGFAPVFSEKGEPLALPENCFAESNENQKESEVELVRSLTYNGKIFSSLPFSEQEVKEIYALFKEKNLDAEYHIFDNATKDSFLASCDSFSVLHLASHGVINEINPKLSGILFYPQADTVRNSTFLQNTLLTTGEIYNLKIHADLVVLSACETGIGRVVIGEGVLSMARALTYAGAKNILYSLWKVGDKNSYKLMVNFYTYLLGGNSYSQALRKAKLEMIKNEETAFPGNWGAFNLIAI
jgi:CHAT domain-containing protein